MERQCRYTYYVDIDSVSSVDIGSVDSVDSVDNTRRAICLLQTSELYHSGETPWENQLSVQPSSGDIDRRSCFFL